MPNNLDYKDIEFSVFKRDFNKIEKKNNICYNAFVMKIIWFILFMY